MFSINAVQLASNRDRQNQSRRQYNHRINRDRRIGGPQSRSIGNVRRSLNRDTDIIDLTHQSRASREGHTRSRSQRQRDREMRQAMQLSVIPAIQAEPRQEGPSMEYIQFHAAQRQNLEREIEAFRITHRTARLKKETRNNLTFLTLLLIVLTWISFSSKDDQNNSCYEKLEEKFRVQDEKTCLDETICGKEVRSTEWNQEISDIGSMKKECLIPLYNWYNSYLICFIFKMALTFIQFLFVRLKDLQTLDDVKDAERFVRKFKLTMYLYLNGIFIIILVYGNFIFWPKTAAKNDTCKKFAQMDCGEYRKTSIVVFILVLFGNAQALYYFTIWISVVCMKFSGHDPMASDEDDEILEDVDNHQSREQIVRQNALAELRRNEEDYRRVLRSPVQQPQVIQINNLNNRGRRRSEQISKSKIVNYFKNEVETISFKKAVEIEEEQEVQDKDLEENKEEPVEIELTYRTRLSKIRKEEEPHCGICLVPFEDGEQLKVLDCPLQQKEGEENNLQNKHIFHEECIVQWFQKKQECPLCRACFKSKVRSVANNGDSSSESEQNDVIMPQIIVQRRPPRNHAREEEELRAAEIASVQLSGLTDQVQNLQQLVQNLNVQQLVQQDLLVRLGQIQNAGNERISHLRADVQAANPDLIINRENQAPVVEQLAPGSNDLELELALIASQITQIHEISQDNQVRQPISSQVVLNEDPQPSSLIDSNDLRPSFIDGNAQEESNLNVPSRIDEDADEYSEDNEMAENQEDASIDETVVQDHNVAQDYQNERE